MKTKLLIAFACMMIAGTLYTNAQKIWALTPQGGAYSGGTIISMNPDGSGFNVEFSYQCSMSTGCMPMGNLMQAGNGQLYGTCYLGGPYASCTVDRYDPITETYHMVYGFDITNGDYPRSGLIDGHNGKLYAAASAGGTSYSGVLYSIDLVTEVYTPMYSFNSATGNAPWGCPILKNGVLYGLTTGGGSYGGGVLYSYDLATSTYTALHHFSSTVDGADPEGSLFEASNGLFYGLTSGGISTSFGTLFSYDPVNNIFTLLHSFNSVDGSAPKGTLMQAADGNLYGVTSAGGINNDGVLFSYNISTSTYTKLYDFVAATGSHPSGDLHQSANLVLYGSAVDGGPSNLGTLFSYDLTTGTYTDLIDFDGTNGEHPAGGFAFVDIPTATQQIAQNVFSVYPNPANDEINIGFVKEAYHAIALRNVTGQIVYATENYALLQKIDISSLPKGVYFVEIKDINGKTTTQKTVKL